MYKSLKIFCIILAIMLFGIIVMSVVFHTRQKLDYVACDDGFEYLDTEYHGLALTRAESKAEVEKAMGSPHYIYIERNCERSHCIALLRVVVIRKGLSDTQYVMELAHELVHLVEFVGNERHTEYRTFVRLYESGNAELRKVANEIAVNHYCHYMPQEYQCWYYIKEYLKKI